MLLAAALVPVGWLGGVGAQNELWLHLIPGKLRAFPIAALLWAGAVLGLPIVLLYDPAPTFSQIVLTPWLCLAGGRGSGGGRGVWHRGGLACGERVGPVVAVDPAEAARSPPRMLHEILGPL